MIDLSLKIIKIFFCYLILIKIKNFTKYFINDIFYFFFKNHQKNQKLNENHLNFTKYILMIFLNINVEGGKR